MSRTTTEPERVLPLNDAPEADGDYVLYWMQQSQRAAFNPALETAVDHANRLGLPVLVAFGLTDAYPDANERHYAFMLEGLVDVAEALRARGIGFVVRRGAPDAVAIRLAQQAALVVCDRGYLRVQRQWRARVARGAGRRVLQVEGDVVVPLDIVSTTPAIGARTLRPKLLRVRDRFLAPLGHAPVGVRADDLNVPSDVDVTDVRGTLRSLAIDRAVSPVPSLRGGERSARDLLRRFVEGGLAAYASARRQLANPQVSWLSPYLHFGQISPVEIALAARSAPVNAADRDSFLDELIVRRELAVNFVETTPHYDTYAAIPEWARRTLDAHRYDPRPHVYSFDQLASAETHDPYWNAAMQDMRMSGTLHNHLRMYWGKKILEWSASPEQAYTNLLTLNNALFLDGRDANSYTNVAWVFGLHDRPWPERPIFGTVRSMTAGGLERKTDVAAYVQRVETDGSGRAPV